MSPTLRRHGTTLALVALTAVAAGVFLLQEGSVTTGEAIGRKKHLLPAFRGDEITEVQLAGSTHRARVFRGELNDAGQRPWQIEVDGAREPAEEIAVDQLLGSLREGVTDRRFKIEASERHAFGLDAPRGEIALTMGAQRYRVRMGGPAPTPPGAVYVEVLGREGDTGAVITAQLASMLEIAPDTLRQKALVSWEASDLDAIALDGAGGPRHLVRAPWRVPRGAGFRFDGSTPEGPVRASAAALDGVWEALGRMKADAFLTAAEAEAAQAHPPRDDAEGAPAPPVTVTLTPHGSKPVTLVVGGACPGHPDDVIALRRGDGPARAACVPRGVLPGLSLPAADLVDRRLVGARSDEVIDVKMQEGEHTLTLARHGSAWHEQTPADRTVEPEVGRAFLDRLLEVQASALLAPAAAGDLRALGLDPPRATVRVASLLGDGDDERVELVEVGTGHGAGTVPVRRVEDGALAELPADVASALLPDELALRSRKALDLPTADFRALRVTGPRGSQRFERRDGGAWVLLEPQGEGLSPDAGMIAELTEAVGTLSVERWVGAARPEHGLDPPRISIAAEVGTGPLARSVEVTLGAPASSGSFARLRGDPAVFVAPHRLEAAADRWMIDRTALLVDVERMTRVTLAAEGGKRLVLEQHGGALHVAGGAAGGPSPTESARAAGVRDALGDLVAEGAVSVGPPEKAQGLDKPALRVTVEQAGKRFEIRFGAIDTLHGARVYDARRDGLAATFAVAESRVRPLLEAVR